MSRGELYGDTDTNNIDIDAAELLSKGLEDQIGGLSSDGSEEDVLSDEDMGSESDGEGYQTGDSENNDSEGAEERVEVNKGGEELDDLKMVNLKNAETEEEKRVSVKFQATAWDKLVQLRLKLQPSLQEISKFPPPEKRTKFMSGDVSQSHRQAIITNIQSSMDKLCDLQDQLYEMNDDIKGTLCGKKIADDDEIPSDTDEEEEADEILRIPKRKRKQNSDFYLKLEKENQGKLEILKSEIIMKWYEQTKVVAKKSSFMNKEVTVLDQINNILSNKEKLVDRTIQNRSSIEIFGETEHASHPYIFNDDDFYQQLLREIIDKKMGNIDTTDPESMGKQWTELQKLKVKAKKKSVDTKASKGRKLRYDVHSKLLGFMAPVSTDTLSDERQNELFNSLFTSKL